MLFNLASGAPRGMITPYFGVHFHYFSSFALKNKKKKTQQKGSFQLCQFPFIKEQNNSPTIFHPFFLFPLQCTEIFAHLCTISFV
jgi:hypothetical protein